MLGPENAERKMHSAKTLGGSPATLYLIVEDVDKVVAKAVKLGATPIQPVMDMFWGDRSGTVVDADGYSWMVGTHIAEPTPEEMKKAMKEQMKAMAKAISCRRPVKNACLAFAPRSQIGLKLVKSIQTRRWTRSAMTDNAQGARHSL